TTILSYEPSKYLQDLEDAIGKEKLQEIGERAAGRGTAMHRFLENYMICIKNGGNSDMCLLYTQKKTPADLREDGMAEDKISYGRDLFYNFIHENVFDNIKRVIFTEKFLWSLQNLFAGTADFGFEHINGKRIITDFKSASGIRGIDVMNKYKKQGAAYALSFEELFKKPIDEVQVWISHPGGMQLEVLAGEELDKKKKEFIELSKDFHANWNSLPFKEYYYEINKDNESTSNS
ncbi:MAG: hypothetical protein RLZZ479_375, partial [Bacteroidota bacterium]